MSNTSPIYRSSEITGGALLIAGLVLGLAGRVVAQTSAVPAGVGFEQKLGESLPLDVTVTNSDGQQVPLKSYFGKRPVVLTPVYYKCPMLCGLELNGLVRCLRGMAPTVGEDFDIVTYSIDPRETASLANKKRKQYLAAYGRESGSAGWDFLTADQTVIDQLNEAIGFQTVYNEANGQYSHAAGIVVCTSDGVISRYLYGVDFAPKDLRLAVLESGRGEVGSLADQVLMFCFMYDPTRGKYGLAILNLLRAGGILTVLVLGSGVIWMLRHEKRRNAEGEIPEAERVAL